MRPPHTCSTSIGPGPAAHPAKCARCAETTEEQLAVAVAAARIHSTRCAPPRPVWRSNWIASGSQACHENGVPTPVTTDYRNLCRILDKTAEKPAIGSALALPRNRCRLYGLGALGSPAFLEDSVGFRRLLPADLSAIVAPLFEVATTYPDHTSEKINSQLAPLFTGSSPKPEFTVRRGLPRWLSSGVVGYGQRGVGGLSDFSNRCGVRARHHGDINESSTVEVCDGWRRAH